MQTQLTSRPSAPPESSNKFKWSPLLLSKIPCLSKGKSGPEHKSLMSDMWHFYPASSSETPNWFCLWFVGNQPLTCKYCILWQWVPLFIPAFLCFKVFRGWLLLWENVYRHSLVIFSMSFMRSQSATTSMKSLLPAPRRCNIFNVSIWRRFLFNFWFLCYGIIWKIEDTEQSIGKVWIYMEI